MIERYSRADIKAVWSEDNKFRKWLDVELAACDAHVELGNISETDNQIIHDKAQFNVARILEIESEIHHDVIAFLTNVAEYVGEPSRFVHLGLTSSDVVDTAFSLLIQEAGSLLQQTLSQLQTSIKTQAYAHQFTPIMGRTHGVHAEPTTVGLKLAVWYSELKRHEHRLIEALDQIRVGKVSGAVGNYAHMPPRLEELVCAKLGLRRADASTQILQRDRHAHFMSTLALIGGTLEKIATEIRALQKTEFNELCEPFSSKQKGSSAMPHKRNPILCERVSGLARVLRGYALTAMENQALWHERDISHSSTERIIFPDATIALDYMMATLIKVMDGLVVNQQQCLDNIAKSYHVFYSQQLLLKLVDKGMSREEAYRLVQKNAHYAFDHQRLFEDQIKEDTQITGLVPESELTGIFTLDKYTVHVAEIFDRVFS